MAKYRKKAVEIDAYQIGHGQMPAWFLKAADEWRIELWADWNPVTRVMTRSGWVEARRHDYVFLNHRDELQVWKEDEFLKVFEPYEEPEKIINGVGDQAYKVDNVVPLWESDPRD